MRCSSNLGKGYLIGPRDKYSWKVTNFMSSPKNIAEIH